MLSANIFPQTGGSYVYAPAPSVSISSPSATTSYKFGTKAVDHRFCSTCGVPVYVIEFQSTVIAVNLKVMQGVEWDEIKVKRNETGQDGYVVD
jgi:hypothetical protein